MYGAGPKMPGFSTDGHLNKSQEKSNKENSNKVNINQFQVDEILIQKF